MKKIGVEEITTHDFNTYWECPNCGEEHNQMGDYAES